MTTPDETNTPAKRGALRFQAGLPSELHYRGQDYPCESFNLSRSGVLVVGQVPWVSDPEVEVTIRTPTSDLCLRIRGRVAHVVNDEEGRGVKTGVEFGDLDEGQQRELEAMISRVVEGMAPAPLEALRPGAPTHEVREALGKISIPHRITLASRATPKEREFLKQDSSPQVLEALARNPQITAAELKTLVRTTPGLLPTTLAHIARDRRWQRDEELKILVATHPRSTMETAEGIVSSLGDLEVQKLLQRPGLHPAVRAKLMAKLSRKHRG